MPESGEPDGRSASISTTSASDSASRSGTHAIDAAQIKAFAAQFDPQPFHLDDEAAKGTLFGGLAASGWHTAAITMRLLVETGLPLMGGIIGAGGEISWPQADAAGRRPSRGERNRGGRLRHARGRTAAWCACAARRATSATRWSRCSSRSSSCRGAHPPAWLRARGAGEQAASGGAACPVQARRLGFVAGCWQHRGCIARVRACALRLAVYLNSAPACPRFRAATSSTGRP